MMRQFLICLNIMIAQLSHGQKDSIDLKLIESMDYPNYIADFNPNPNEYFKSILKDKFNDEEIGVLKEAGSITFNVVIDTYSDSIVMVYNKGLNLLSGKLKEKVENIFYENITVSPRKIVDSSPDYRYIIKGFIILID